MKNINRFNYGFFVGVTIWIVFNLLIPLLQGESISGVSPIILTLWILSGIYTYYSWRKMRLAQ